MDEFGEFQGLLDLHQDFAQALLAHQEALVRGDLADALVRARALEAELVGHIRLENEVLLPVLERGGGWSRIGAPDFYRDEHEKILAGVAELVAETRALDPADPALHRRIALLIGREQRFRSLLEHHDDRERRALYPDLLRLTTPDERADLLRGLD